MLVLFLLACSPDAQPLAAEACNPTGIPCGAEEAVVCCPGDAVDATDCRYEVSDGEVYETWNDRESAYLDAAKHCSDLEALQ